MVTRRPQRKGCFCMGHNLAHGKTMFFSAPLCAAFARLCVIPLPLLFIFLPHFHFCATRRFTYMHCLIRANKTRRCASGARGRRGYGSTAGDSGARFVSRYTKRVQCCASRGARSNDSAPPWQNCDLLPLSQHPAGLGAGVSKQPPNQLFLEGGGPHDGLICGLAAVNVRARRVRGCA